MRLFVILWMRLLSIMGQLRESIFWNTKRLEHKRLSYANPAKLSDEVIASFVRWHGHQTEKATKHQSSEYAISLSKYHYDELIQYLGELERRSGTRYSCLIEWAKEILDNYESWRKTLGYINIKKPSTFYGRRRRFNPKK